MKKRVNSYEEHVKNIRDREEHKFSLFVIILIITTIIIISTDFEKGNFKISNFTEFVLTSLIGMSPVILSIFEKIKNRLNSNFQKKWENVKLYVRGRFSNFNKILEKDNLIEAAEESNIIKEDIDFIKHLIFNYSIKNYSYKNYYITFAIILNVSSGLLILFNISVYLNEIIKIFLISLVYLLLTSFRLLINLADDEVPKLGNP